MVGVIGDILGFSYLEYQDPLSMGYNSSILNSRSPNEYSDCLKLFLLVGTAFASSLYVPSVSQHCSEAHGCSLCRRHEQNSYHGNNEYFFGEGSSMAGSN